MSYREIYEPYRREVEERYPLVMERIGAIPEETTVSEPFRSYFFHVAKFIIKMHKFLSCVEEGRFFDLSLEDMKEQNQSVYFDILPENYKDSYANPAYSVKALGEDYGRLFSALYAWIRRMAEYAAESAVYEMTIYGELFVEIYNCFEETDKPGPEEVRGIIYWFCHDYSEIFVERSLSRQVNPEDDFFTDIIENADLSDLRYLYRYGNHIGKNELQIAAFLNQMSDEKLQDMADTYTEGYRKSFEVGGKDLSIKKTVDLHYPIGFERMMRAAVKNFRALGLRPVVRRGSGRSGVSSMPPNEQYDYDHKADDAVYLDKAYAERRLECMRTSYEEFRELAAVYAGPAVVEVFGGEPFTPVQKKENYQYNEKQQKINVYFANMSGQIVNEFIPGEERSFTIIAYPVPEIGDKFEEIFEKTVEINNLDYDLYRDMQQKIIDVLDQGEYVHILGKGANRTDLKVALYPLKDRSKETCFENCVADANIPVGEVFTSPMLKGTEGVLHVTQVYLHQLKYKNLELTFRDGQIAEYTCENFDNEEENKSFIKENLLYHHDTLPLGEFAVGTNTLAYRMGKDYGIAGKLPILIAEKTGPHFAVGDTCYSWAEDSPVYNPDGKEIVARDNDISILRKEDKNKAYFNCHTDITIPYDELGSITVITEDGERLDIINEGKFVVSGTEELNVPLTE